MKLEVGMYYRTKIGKIGFIEDKLKLMCLQDELKQEYVKQEIDNIKKSSFNIIDLIEVRDYVNGWKVESYFKSQHDDIIKKGIYVGGSYTNLEEIKIREILTHEQYEANCYKVGE